MSLGANRGTLEALGGDFMAVVRRTRLVFPRTLGLLRFTWLVCMVHVMVGS